jgi:hypothetical protein
MGYDEIIIWTFSYLIGSGINFFIFNPIASYIKKSILYEITKNKPDGCDTLLENVFFDTEEI